MKQTGIILLYKTEKNIGLYVRHNGKRILIDKKDFVIGKEKNKVDYCISGDTTVSRVHALIRNIGGKYYIEDQASTNYSFYEGKQIPQYKPVYLEDGSRFRLSDVEFEFHAGGIY